MQDSRNHEKATLYERLGGAEGISTLVDDIVEAHLANPTIKARYGPMNSDPAHMARAKQHLRDFLGAGSGGPETYTGRSMAEIHRGMNIDGSEYMAATDDIMWALDKNGIDEETKKDVLAIAYGLKSEIMHI
jgi:hemoglobin